MFRQRVTLPAIRPFSVPSPSREFISLVGRCTSRPTREFIHCSPWFIALGFRNNRNASDNRRDKELGDDDGKIVEETRPSCPVTEEIIAGNYA
jgi:hypothetical protein